MVKRQFLWRLFKRPGQWNWCASSLYCLHPAINSFCPLLHGLFECLKPILSERSAGCPQFGLASWQFRNGDAIALLCWLIGSQHCKPAIERKGAHPQTHEHASMPFMLVAWLSGPGDELFIGHRVGSFFDLFVPKPGRWAGIMMGFVQFGHRARPFIAKLHV